jgi:SAM-dependent methyltransferase
MPEYSHEAFAEHAARAAQKVTDLVDEWLQPESVLDVGCGLGVWTNEWLSRSRDVTGVDGPYLERSRLRLPQERFVVADLKEPLDLGRRFDLVISLEVAEHLPEEAADGFVLSLTSHADAVLFSAAIPRQGGEFHVNCQWPSYWQTRFAAHGFTTFDLLRPRLWDDESIVWWYRQNMLLFARGESADRLARVAEVDRPIDLVHPRWYLDFTEPRSFRTSLRESAAAGRRALIRRAGDRQQDG